MTYRVEFELRTCSESLLLSGETDSITVAFGAYSLVDKYDGLVEGCIGTHGRELRVYRGDRLMSTEVID